jgi:hypothetical protein
MCASDGRGSSHPSPWRRHTYSRCEIGCLAAAPVAIRVIDIDIGLHATKKPFFPVRLCIEKFRS